MEHGIGVAARTILERGHATATTPREDARILTACLACGWVHGYPWRCPAGSTLAVLPAISRQIRPQFVRVGKANTLLLTPNDGSTLSNGTVDGEPTGLHRYVGENRFVFVPLNVTDGHGNLVSYDLESKDTIGAYVDLSGTGKTGYHSGATPETGRFGLAARLSGSGSYVSANDDDNKLDEINGAMTVSFWIRPDQDYVGGSGWKWSFGRQGLWKLGFVDGKLRFEVTQSVVPYTVHAAQTVGLFPLYAGRWVHLAATMTPWATTNLSVYANGALVAWSNNASSYEARDGVTWLYLGYDAATGTAARFKGLIDEFRLYKTALLPDAVRGLPWFLHGSNNVLVPRGVFFDSKLFAALNGSFDPNSPLAGANVNGNDNKGVAHLNARVIQMVITKNATLAQAWKVLDLAATNKSNVVTSFGLIVTNEFYTLGLAKEVRDLAANVVVENSGNVSAPPPSPTLWQLFWNTLAGLAASAWNAVVAVAQFFINVGKWLVDAAIGLVVGLVTGNWQYFNDNVLEPLRKAIEAFVAALTELVKSAISGLFAPVASALASVTGSLSSYLLFTVFRHFDPSPLDVAAFALEGLFGAGGIFFWLFAVVAGIVEIFEWVPPLLFLKPMLNLIRNFIIFVLTPLILLVTFGLTLAVPSETPRPGLDGGVEVLREKVPDEIQFITELPYAWADLFLTFSAIAVQMRGGKIPWVATAVGMAIGALGIALGLASINREPAWMALTVDMIALIVSLVGWYFVATDPAGATVPLTSAIAASVAVIGIAIAMNAVLQDIAAWNRGE